MIAKRASPAHYIIVATQSDRLTRTHASLIHRLKNWGDHASWQRFFETYWKLIYGVAKQSGLSAVEAQDVVQETLLVVARKMPDFKYDPAIGSFKAWLLIVTRQRIISQFRKRGPLGVEAFAFSDTATGTAMVARIPDPNGVVDERVWDAEWSRTLLEAATAKVRRRHSEKYQIYDFYVNKGWPPERVAERFGVKTAQVYVIKSRLTKMIAAEGKRLAKNMT